MNAYREVVFARGDDATSIIDRLCRGVDGILYRGHTDESVAWAVEHLAQWDTGEGEVRGSVAFGDSTTVEHGHYLLAWSSRLDYIGLYRKVARCWADSFGTWHAAVTHDEADPAQVAKQAIIEEIKVRERNLNPQVRVHFVNMHRDSREWIFREVTR